MKVNSQDTNPTSQTISNSSAVAIKEPDNSQEQLNSELVKLADDIHHQYSPKEPVPTYNKSMTITTNNVAYTREDEEKSLDNSVLSLGHLYAPGGDVPRAVETMLSPYDAVMAELASEQPALANKGWGISINQSNELEVTGSLSNDEKALIAEKLNSNEELVTAANDFKSSYLKYIDMEVRGWADYDVNEDNFAEVFNFKDMLESSRSDEDFNKHWDYETNWLKLTGNISAQLRSKASKG